MVEPLTSCAIGLPSCEEFAEQGCIVYATARSVEKMEGFKHEDIRTVALDVMSDEQVESVVKKIVEGEGRIDILVNNAGVICVGVYQLEYKLN